MFVEREELGGFLVVIFVLMIMLNTPFIIRLMFVFGIYVV